MNYIVLMQSVVSGVQPAWAPNEAVDVEEAYSPFVFSSKDEAVRETDEDTDALNDAVENGDLSDATVTWIEPCIVHEDGGVELVESGRILSREQIFLAFGMDVPVRPAP